MKAQLMALAAALASTPALASLGASDRADRGMDLQPADFAAPSTVPAVTGCGQPRVMLFILRDGGGGVVAAALVQVKPDC